MRGSVALCAFIILFLLSSYASDSLANEPLAATFISPTQWGGTATDMQRARRHHIERITLHHGGVSIDPKRTSAEYLRALQNWSRSEKAWIDIPYHYLIDKHGQVFEGRDISAAGDTNTEYDPTGHALIAVLGNFEDEEPSAEQLNAIVDTMARLAIIHSLGIETIASHRDYSTQTACPGKHLTRYLQNGWITEKVRERIAELQSISRMSK